jgi:transposase
MAKGLSQELRDALDPLLGEIESLNERVAEYDRWIEQIAKEVYPQIALLKQVKGVGTLIALAYVLTLDDPHRFRRSRDAGCFIGLRPGRRNSGMSQPQLHISKEGDVYLRTMLVQGAHYILGPFGEDSDLRRWGLKPAERGGKNAKKRAVVAVARKLAVPLHKLWVSGEVYETAAEQPQSGGRSSAGKGDFNSRAQRPSSGDCAQVLAQLLIEPMGAEVDYQVAAPAETSTPN